MTHYTKEILNMLEKEGELKYVVLGRFYSRNLLDEDVFSQLLTAYRGGSL